MSLAKSVRGAKRWFARSGLTTRGVGGTTTATTAHTSHNTIRWRTGCFAITCCLLASPVLAQPKAPKAASPAAAPSAEIDAQLFFQLLVGEIQWREGERSAAFELMLDAARRTKSEQLFLRATEMALQSKAGDQALIATKSWRTALPQSAAAHNYLAQLLVALNRPQEAVEPLRALISLSPPEQRAPLIASIQRFFTRIPDRKMAAGLVEEILKPYAEVSATQTASLLTTSRAWLAAKDTARAWAFLRKAHTLNPKSIDPALMAAEMMREVPEAEEVISTSLRDQPNSTDLRLLYSRSLIASQRYADAITQLEYVTQANPDVIGPWLTLGALHVELNHPRDGRRALNTYLQRIESQAAMPSAGEMATEDDSEAAPDSGQTEAWMQLAEAAEQENEFEAAEFWLAKVVDPQRAVQVQQRRASLLVKQGKLSEALSLVAKLPDGNDEQARIKSLAQTQVLRDAKRWREAYVALQASIERFPDDPAFLYERAMVAEKLGEYEAMESMLRHVMRLKPDYALAHNALGYSLADRNLRLPEAKALIQRALELAPGDPMFTDSLGWVEYRLGHRDEALRLLRWAMRARPDAEIGAHLGEVLWVMGQRDEAMRVWRDSKVRDPKNEVLLETLKRLQVQL